MASASDEGLGFGSEDIDALISALPTEVELLKGAWRNEKASPEILQFQEDVVRNARAQIQNMEDTVEAYAENGKDALTVSLYQMDLDRTEFLLRSYLRTRLQKMEKYMIHISKTELWNRLSEPEQKFVTSCKENMENHLKQSVLSRLPYGYQDFLKQSISSEEDDMVPEPQLDTFVFCKSKGSIGSFQLDAVGDEVVDLIADDLYVLRYKSIKPLVEMGQIDLV
ncbi:hypothetical protein MKX01_003010 [Papaver californicum]|nr:hypothetical protein MKX01_003010 [Papaver californicum]